MPAPKNARRPLRAIGYVRVSRVNGRAGDSFISPEVQRETIERLAAGKGAKIVEWFEDLDQSGGKYERPGFQRALAMIEAGDADLFLVAKLSRFARSASDTYTAIERITSRKPDPGAFAAADLDIDVSTPIGQAILGIFSVLAQLELDIATENWVVARAVATAKGKWPGSLPLGYRRTSDKRVEVDPVVGPAIAEIFRGRGEGLPFTELAERFTRQTRRALHPQSLDKIVQNPAYLGELKSGDLVLDVDPLVTRAEWTAAQSVNAPRPPRSKTGSLLGGILTCGSCGRPMSYRGERLDQYTCQRFANGERCTAPVQIGAAKIDAYVEREFLDRHVTTAAVLTSADQDELGAAEREHDRAVADLAATLALDLGSAGTSGPIADLIAAKTAAVDEALARVEELQGSERLDKRLERVGEVWPDLDLVERQRLLAAAVESLTVHRVGAGARTPIEQRVSLAFAGGQAASAAA